MLTVYDLEVLKYFVVNILRKKIDKIQIFYNLFIVEKL